MELLVWGPAFGLPSIDHDCISAIAYLHQVLPPEQWLLLLNDASSRSPTANPTADVPSLRVEGTTYSGLASIKDYLRDRSLDLDHKLSRRQKADIVALQAHLHTNALPLLDYSLYTSSNYTSHTRPAWRRILPSPASHFIPADRYTAAEARTTPLGLSSSAIEPDTDPNSTAGFTPEQQQEARMISSSPSLLFKKRQTVQAALRQKQSQTRFRIEALVDTLLDPVEAMLGTSKYLVSDGVTSIDCLAFGYLALLLYPQLPQNAVAETIRQHYPKTVRYTDRLREEIFKGEMFDVDEIMQAPSVSAEAESKTICGLPYRTPDRLSTKDTIVESSTSVIGRLLRPLTQQPLIFASPTWSPFTNAPSSLLLRSWTHPLSLVISVTAPLIAGTAWFLYHITHTDREREKRFGKPLPKLHSFGAAGDMLAAFQMPYIGLGGQAMQRMEQDTPPQPANQGDAIDVQVSV